MRVGRGRGGLQQGGCKGERAGKRSHRSCRSPALVRHGRNLSQRPERLSTRRLVIQQLAELREPRIIFAEQTGEEGRCVSLLHGLEKLRRSVLAASDVEALPSAEPPAASGGAEGGIEHATRARHTGARHPEHALPRGRFRTSSLRLLPIPRMRTSIIYITKPGWLPHGLHKRHARNGTPNTPKHTETHSSPTKHQSFKTSPQTGALTPRSSPHRPRPASQRTCSRPGCRRAWIA